MYAKIKRSTVTMLEKQTIISLTEQPDEVKAIASAAWGLE